MAKTTKPRQAKAVTDFRQVRARRVMDEFDEVLGESAESTLSFVLEAEREVSRWLSDRGRKATEPLHFEDLAAIVRETTWGTLSARFAAALWALRRAIRPGEPRVDANGALVLDTDAPLASRLPSIVKVSRVTSPTRRALTLMLRDVSKALTESAVSISPEIRAAAFFGTIAARRSPWRTRPKGAPATLGEIAKGLSVSKDGLRQAIKRERRAAVRSGVMTPGKSGRPKK